MIDSKLKQRFAYVNSATVGLASLVRACVLIFTLFVCEPGLEVRIFLAQDRTIKQHFEVNDVSQRVDAAH